MKGVNDKPKEEPMDTADAQASMGSDGIMEPQVRLEVSTSPPASTETAMPVRKKVMVSQSMCLS